MKLAPFVEPAVFADPSEKHRLPHRASFRPDRAMVFPRKDRTA
jgi:hypothetical protein